MSWIEISDVLLKVFTTLLFIWLCIIVYRWYKHDEDKRKKQEMLKRKAQYLREVELAGQRLLEEDEKRRILKENGIHQNNVYYKKNANKMSESEYQAALRERR